MRFLSQSECQHMPLFTRFRKALGERRKLLNS